MEQIERRRDPETGRLLPDAPEAIEAKLWSRIEIASDGCYRWTGTIHRGAPIYRHRSARAAVYRALVGPVPPGHVLRPSCPTEGCVRPEHMRLVRREHLLIESYLGEQS